MGVKNPKKTNTDYYIKSKFLINVSQKQAFYIFDNVTRQKRSELTAKCAQHSSFQFSGHGLTQLDSDVSRNVLGCNANQHHIFKTHSKQKNRTSLLFFKLSCDLKIKVLN